MDSCGVVKRIARLGMDLKKTVVVDNTPNCYKENKANAIPIRSWNKSQKKDKQLLKVLDTIKKVKRLEDVRKGIARLYS